MVERFTASAGRQLVGVVLVVVASFAFAFEKRVQGWNRAKREALIRGEYAALPDLSRRSAVQRRRAADGGFEAQA